jgi:hypothetical protein
MSYCSQADIENLFGVENVAAWSNLDNQSTTADAARIAAAIAYAGAFLDDRFRNSRYAVPLVGLSDPLVQVTDLAARLAGCWLYESRGLADRAGAAGPGGGGGDGDAMPAQRRYVQRMVGRYLAGQDQLPAVQARMVTTVPQVSGW